jgi:hypothetical protein
MTEPDPLKLSVLFGSSERRGAWAVPAHIDARVTLGHIQLDLRDADLGADTTIEADLMLGSLQILVPSDVMIDVDVELLAGRVNGDRPSRDITWSAARRLRVIGRAWFASCEITRAA